ncbi:hypothetical protein COHA_007122, partial [Chlorella ohadii]
QQRPAAAASMLYCPLPFDGLLVPAGTAVGQHDSAAKAAAAAAARLYTAADVQSLQAVLFSPSVQADLAAAALGQLAQVAGDARFGVLLGQEPVLATLQRHAQGGSPCHHTQQPALACLVAMAEQLPSAADWLLADADVRCAPLLPLAFHPLPAVRQQFARLLDILLFGTAARQLHSLAAQLSDGPADSRSTSTAGLPQAAVPEPFCASYLFARPTAVLPVAAALHPQPPASIFGSEGQQRLWRARQLCHTAAAGGEGGSAGSLLQVLSGPSLVAAPVRWEADFVRSSLAMLRGLQPEALVADGLRLLATSESHQQCHAALRRLELLVAALPEGLGTLGAAPWRDALDLLLSAAPLSPEDCALWADMLPLLQQLMMAALVSCSPGQQAAALEPHVMLRLAEQFAGGSALSFVEQLASGEDHHAAALLPAVLHTVHLMVRQAGRLSRPEQRELMLQACRAELWLDLADRRLEAGQWGYAARVAALQLATALLEACKGCTDPASCPRLLAAVVRRVLMPRELWDTHHCHGKAAVLASLQLLLSVTQPSCAAERLMLNHELWSSIGAVLQEEEEDATLLSAAAHAVLQRALLDAEGAVQLLGGGAVLLRLLRQPAATLSGVPGNGAMPAVEQAAAAAHAFRAAHAAAALVAAIGRLAPAKCWAEVSAAPGLLEAASSAFSWAVSTGRSSLPHAAEPAVASLQRSAQDALAPLADAIALLAQANANSTEQLGAACNCTPLPLASAVATAMSSPQLQQARAAGPLLATCCRLLAVLLQEEAVAQCFLLDSSGQEHQLPAAEPSLHQPVGAVLSASLMEQWLEAAAARNGSGSEEGSTDEQQQQRQVLDVALGGLLTYSGSAKQVALDAGLHTSLLDSCRALAASLAGPVAAPPLPQPAAAAHRTAKLQQLREARRSGTKQPAAVLAFGSRVANQAPAASKRSGRHSSCGEQSGSSAVAVDAGQEPEVQPEDHAEVASQTEPRPPDQPPPSLHAHPQQRQMRLMLSLLSLLQRLAHNSAPACSSLVEAGAMDVAAVLWGTGGPAVQTSLLSLLATLLHNSAEARATCASTGAPPVLERLVAAVLAGRSQPVAALAAFAASPDGARVLTALCTQPEGQRAVLACSTPSDTMLGVLLSLAEHSTPAPAAAAAAAAAVLLRQLALCPEAKAHFVSRRGALQTLLDAVSAAGAQPERAAAAAHALWALVHGGERVKVAVRRCEGWEQALALAACRQEQPALKSGVKALLSLLAK